VILHGQKKKVLKEVIRYYVETTGKEYEDFILEVQKTRAQITPDMPYSEWLSVMVFSLISKHEITIADCIENKDTIRSAIKEEESRMGGEFYTPEVWCLDGREYLKDMLGDLWGKAYIWDASCGTGNLLKTADYPTDKIFMSSLLHEDIELVKSYMPGVHAFQCDFVNDIDWDERNKRFSEKLPPELVAVFERNDPIVFYMNPPYKVMEASSSDVGSFMASHGMAKCALDIFHQFMYRLVMIKKFYRLTNVYMGIFGPVTMFHSKMIEPMYEEFKQEFKFHDGMCFSAGDFANTSESVGWIVGYTAWRSKINGEEDKSIVLDAKSVDAEGNVSTIGKRLITSIEENLDTWVKASDIMRYDAMLPMVTTFNNPVGTVVKSPRNSLGYMMSSNFVIRATRRACVTSLPNPDNIAITEENFWRCVASFVARRCYASKTNPYNNCQYYSKPDVSIEGYNQWLTDALIVFLFDFSAHQAAYRDLVVEEQFWNTPNKMFPISQDIVKSVVTDQAIIHDMESNPAQNEFILNLLTQLQANFSPEAMELYQFSLQLILESLMGTKRADSEYENWTKAWDAGLIQVKSTKGLITTEQEERYSYLLSKLKHKLYDGVYKYGFMMDTAFAVEDEMAQFEEEEETEVVL
jgi:hypothetical protein